MSRKKHKNRSRWTRKNDHQAENASRLGRSVSLGGMLRRALVPLLILLAGSGCSESTPPAPQSYPEPGSEAMTMFIARCGACHAAPQPGSHVATIWPGVVQRMQLRMRSMGKQPLSRQELATIIDYLQRNAGTAATQ
jgi:hypothetical protein